MYTVNDAIKELNSLEGEAVWAKGVALQEVLDRITAQKQIISALLKN